MKDFKELYHEKALNLLNEEEVNFIIKDNEFDTNKISDGYHTFGELYEHRVMLFLALCNFVNLYTEKPIWKSRKHHDGSFMEGWFIMGIDDEKGKQISYHLPDKYWEDAFCAELEAAPEWDGHASADVLERLKQLL